MRKRPGWPIQPGGRTAVTSDEMHSETTPAPAPELPSVLVVDDEPQVVWVLQFSLEAEGYTTYAASNGIEALSEIARASAELMVLDIMMPDDGRVEPCSKRC